MAERQFKRIKVEQEESQLIQWPTDRPITSSDIPYHVLPQQSHLPPAHSSQYGSMIADGRSRVHNGDNIGTHHHYHGQVKKEEEEHKQGTLQIEALKESLAFERMDARLRNVSTALPQTCKWLFKHSQFLRWSAPEDATDHNGLLWIKGKPGCGKSTIMKTALNWTNKHWGNTFVTISYFFNARAPEPLEKSSLGLYRSLVFQLFELCQPIREAFLIKFSSKQRSITVEEWTTQELQDFLIEVLTIIGHPLCVFVDALDEGKEEDVRGLISFLEELAMHAEEAGTKLRIGLSSRHYPHISVRRGLSLVVEDQLEHDQDIEHYIRKKLVSANSPRIDALRSELCSKAAGIFLWVVLVVPILNLVHDQGKGVDAMLERLKHIPQGLEGLFIEIIRETPEEEQLSVILLQWVLFSIRPLTPPELYLGVTRSSGFQDQQSQILPEHDSIAKYLLTCSRGLVEETKSKPPVIQFIHETVREFLLGPKGLSQGDPELRDNLIGASHNILAVICNDYISNIGHEKHFQETLRLAALDLKSSSKLGDWRQDYKKTYPLAEYATNNLFIHAEQAESFGIRQVYLMSPPQHPTLTHMNVAFRQSRNLLARYQIRHYNSEVTLLYFLAEQGLSTLIGAHLGIYQQSNSRKQGQLRDEKYYINYKCGRFGTALQAACFMGHLSSVRALIHHGASVNERNGEHGHPLFAAIIGKHFEIAELIRLHGGLLDLVESRKLLMMLIARASARGIETLIDMGVDLSLKTDKNRSVIYMAVSKNNIEVVETLVRGGASVNADGTRTLRVALENNNEEIIDFLLDNGYRLPNSYPQREHLLRLAAQKGKLKLVQQLLHQDFENCPEPVKWLSLALLDAAGKGHDSIVKVLLDRGANVNFSGYPDGHYNSVHALYWASSQGHLTIVRSLLDAGASVNLQKCFEHSLAAASAEGHLEIVQTLLEHSSQKTDMRSSTGWPGLISIAGITAAHRGHLDIVKLLVEHGADMDARGERNESMLSVACENGKKDIAEYLLSQGVDPNAKVGSTSMEAFQTTVLALAAHRGYPNISLLLIRHGALINVQTELGTAMTVAAGRCRLEIIQILLEAGAARLSDGSWDVQQLQTALLGASRCTANYSKADMAAIMLLLQEKLGLTCTNLE